MYSRNFNTCLCISGVTVGYELNEIIYDDLFITKTDHLYWNHQLMNASINHRDLSRMPIEIGICRNKIRSEPV